MTITEPAETAGPVNQEGSGLSETKESVAPARSGEPSAETTQKESLHMGGSNSQGHSMPAEPPASKPLSVRVSQRINPDDHRFVRLIVIMTVIAGLVAFAISFVAIMEVAAWMGLPVWMHWAIPAFIDVAILTYAGAVLVQKSRGEPTWVPWSLLAIFTALSVVANVAHAMSHDQQTEWQSWVAAVIAGMVPIAVFAATEQLARVAVEDPAARRKQVEEAQQAEIDAQQRAMEREEREFEARLRREEQQTQLELARAKRDAQVAQARKPTPPPGPKPVAPRPKPTATSSAASASSGSSASFNGTGRKPTVELDEIASYVIEYIQAEDKPPSGAVLARKFGFTDKTGRQKLRDLRAERPEIFSDQEEG